MSNSGGDWVSPLIDAVSGPASGVVISVMCLGWFGWFLIKHLLPGHERHLDKILATHTEDRALFRETITAISSELKILSLKVGSIDQKLGSIEDDVRELKNL